MYKIKDEMEEIYTVAVSHQEKFVASNECIFKKLRYAEERDEEGHDLLIKYVSDLEYLVRGLDKKISIASGRVGYFENSIDNLMDDVQDIHKALLSKPAHTVEESEVLNKLDRGLTKLMSIEVSQQNLKDGQVLLLDTASAHNEIIMSALRSNDFNGIDEFFALVKEHVQSLPEYSALKKALKSQDEFSSQTVVQLQDIAKGVVDVTNAVNHIKDAVEEVKVANFAAEDVISELVNDLSLEMTDAIETSRVETVDAIDRLLGLSHDDLDSRIAKNAALSLEIKELVENVQIKGSINIGKSIDIKNQISDTQEKIDSLHETIKESCSSAIIEYFALGSPKTMDASSVEFVVKKVLLSDTFKSKLKESSMEVFNEYYNEHPQEEVEIEEVRNAVRIEFSKLANSTITEVMDLLRKSVKS